jgi:hypothetical protein
LFVGVIEKVWKKFAILPLPQIKESAKRESAFEDIPGFVEKAAFYDWQKLTLTLCSKADPPTTNNIITNIIVILIRALNFHLKSYLLCSFSRD